MNTKFKLSPARQGAEPSVSNVAAFVSDAAMVRSQADTRTARMVPLNLNIDADHHRRLKIRAIEEGATVSDVVRNLIAAWLDSRP
ncbi:hypothetical protein DF142_21110 [Burkholderia cenocepacia]|uniref:plasmid partition protein ParG n=1 Tax=Burkholderia cenocepacia TaxID=95486 RepID=UPI000F5610A1|nr:plasmid partition protein ParG [Burkholderia cenocepacia]RQU38927.1 hypothetical protein DF142_21110 [Burkholderia cenocepacia]RQU63153.1 hypothetical protein DF140_22715 [Burkholderia cenocepacia]